jgi:glutamine amidotransferase
MCRLLAVKDSQPFAITKMLRDFAEVARASREYQGHGWGCAWWDHGAWRVHRSIVPIWEDRLDTFPTTRVLVAHARSAFRNEGIAVENNMPFVEGDTAFVFNGELRGVRIAEAGRIGAEKLFRFLLRLGATRGPDEARRGVAVVTGRTRYVRAMNYVMARGPTFLVCSRFNEDPGYFTMHVRQTPTGLMVSSDPLPGESGWEPFPEGAVEEFA